MWQFFGTKGIAGYVKATVDSSSDKVHHMEFPSDLPNPPEGELESSQAYNNLVQQIQVRTFFVVFWIQNLLWCPS